MKKDTLFLVFCLESYKQAHHLTGKATLEIFQKYQVMNYLESFYDVLHSTGPDYIVKDIDTYIQVRK